jgi:hypothetical protein
MRRFPFAVIATIAAAGLGGVFPASAGAASLPAVGVADQKVSAFASGRFRALHVRRTRSVVPWNVALVPGERARFDEWLAGARGAGVREVLVAFNVARGSRCPRSPCRLPSTGSYARAFRAFHRRYPQIRLIQPWNEANSPTQPTAPWRTGARAAASYYNVARRHCRGCTVTGADVLDLSHRAMARWLGQFRRYAHGTPRLWGLHNYTDTNRGSGMTRAFLRLVPGQVWLTETGGIVYFRKASGSVNLRYSERRAANSLKRMFTIARKYRSRIRRLYVYQWSIDFSGNRFDAGLVGATGSPRPGYYVLKHHRRWIR